MHKYLSTYLRETDALIESGRLQNADAVLRLHLDKIQFMQHERLIHFLVTILFALVFFICLGFFLVTTETMLLPILALVLILLVPYIFHYYFLENSVQKMYVQYDRLLELKQKSEENA
ncbi:MAG: hypothetical protein IJY85_10085 [Ruminococcus sp.]|nr:hypothetical protein [Ruminococcus sp.]